MLSIEIEKASMGGNLPTNQGCLSGIFQATF